jgi:hypothetical protein
MRAEASVVSLATISGRIPRMWVIACSTLASGGWRRRESPEPGIDGVPCSRSSCNCTVLNGGWGGWGGGVRVWLCNYSPLQGDI